MKTKTFQEGLDKAWQEYVKTQREKKYPNIMLLGISGAGKSSLVNRVCMLRFKYQPRAIHGVYK